jgi:predicted PurR-regulated permease PerM
MDTADKTNAKATGRRLEEIVALVALSLLLIGCFLVLRPFVTSVLWAVIMTFTCWPIYRRLLALCRQRRTLAAFLMSLAITVVVLLPFVLIGTKLAESARELVMATRTWIESKPADPPQWLESLPLVGKSAAESWREIGQDSTQFLRTCQKYLEPASAWVLRAGLSLTAGLLQLALSILIAFFLFRDGVAASEWLTASVVRFGGERGRRLLQVAGETVRGVVYGILGTALVQATIAGIGFAIAGVPGAVLLTLFTFFLSVIPGVGPPLIWAPAALWLFREGRTGWGVFMLIWGAGVSSIDNFVKPFLISQGARLPFILIFLGVVGGILAFGFIGIFLGPTLLAVGFRLAREWAVVRRQPAGDPAPEPGDGARP